MKTPENAADNNVGRKTPDEIKKGLECCATLDGDCESCPYDDLQIFCGDRLRKDAISYIQQLESRLAQAEKERDAAVCDLRTFVDRYVGCLICDKTRCVGCNTSNNWSWRGVCPENTKEEG